MYNKLTKQEEDIIIHKGTEAPFSGKFYEHKESGNYHCKQCDALLFSSDHKFDSGCGWPSFDDEVSGAINKTPDKDGKRIEITCAKCSGHLGHIFKGEGLTPKNTRYCVNSISLKFEANNDETAYFAAGCFWGVEHYFKKANGIKSAISGYMGGKVKNPTYEEVCSKKTHHLETVKVIFNPSKTNFEELCKLFFEIHDPCQNDGQGPDIGPQYLSAIFTVDKNQEEIAKKLIKILEEKGLKITTKILKAQEEGAGKFWPAENYHQNYYQKTNKEPYCHFYIKKF